MDVQPERAVEQRFRNERAVRGDDDCLDIVHLCGLVQLLGLAHFDAEPLGGVLRRRRAHLPTSTPGPVRPRDQERDVVPLAQPLEDVSAERRGSGHGNVQSAAACRKTASASRRPSGVVRSTMSTPSR